MTKLKPEYRSLANPRLLDKFLDGNGVLADRRDIADAFDYDWHARKLIFPIHFRGHVLLQATAYKSVHDHQSAASEDMLFAANGAGVEISVSGLAQANRNRPLEPLLVMMQSVMDAVARLPSRRLRALDQETWRGIVQLLQRTDLFDATTLILPPKLREWAAGKHEGSSAFKLQVCLDGWRGDFKRILITPEPGNDSPYFRDLLGDLEEQEGRIFVFDGGYWKLETYHDIVESGNHFVTKRGGKTKPHLIKALPLPEEPLASQYEVLADSLVYLGDRHDRRYRMLQVRQTTGNEIVLLSSLTDCSADKICLLYRYRWTIEIVFRWLRQTLELDHLMSHDPVGVLRQLLTALIVWGLLVIANQDPTKLSPKKLWRRLMADIHQAVYEAGYRQGRLDALGLSEE
jgi:hypothetical protein